MEDKKQHGYYVTIPMELVQDSKVKATTKLLYGVICNLSNQSGYCYATNKYLAEFMGLHEMTISNQINELLKSGYLNRKDIPNGNNTERQLYIGKANDLPPSTKKLRPGKSKRLDPLSQNTEHNKQSIINKSNNIGELHDYFNSLRKEYGHELLELTDGRIKLYDRLLKAYKLADLKMVAEFRFQQLSSIEYRHYQVPETVFRVTKLEGFISAAKSRNSGQDNQLYQIY